MYTNVNNVYTNVNNVRVTVLNWKRFLQKCMTHTQNGILISYDTAQKLYKMGYSFKDIYGEE